MSGTINNKSFMDEDEDEYDSKAIVILLMLHIVEFYYMVGEIKKERRVEVNREVFGGIVFIGRILVINWCDIIDMRLNILPLIFEFLCMQFFGFPFLPFPSAFININIPPPIHIIVPYKNEKQTCPYLMSSSYFCLLEYPCHMSND